MIPPVRLRSSPTRWPINCTKVCLSRRIFDSDVLRRMVYDTTRVRTDGTQPAKRIASTRLNRSKRVPVVLSGLSGKCIGRWLGLGKIACYAHWSKAESGPDAVDLD